MPMNTFNKNDDGYKFYVFSFLVLSALTLLGVWLAHVRFAPALTVALIMVIAVVQATILLLYNMHLKFHEKILRIFVGGIAILLFFLIIVTMLDYIYR